jgi:hypothetical protein
MEHALPVANPRHSLAMALAAALLGAAVATTTYALIDSDKSSPPKVVVVEPSGADSQPAPTPWSGPRP